MMRTPLFGNKDHPMSTTTKEFLVSTISPSSNWSWWSQMQGISKCVVKIIDDQLILGLDIWRSYKKNNNG